MQYLLGIETSCDDTSAAVCADGRVVSNVVSSQLEHSQYGGVIPELASRQHLARIDQVVQAALAQAGIASGQLGAVAVTAGPGLMGALLVGTGYAKGLCLAHGLPLVAVDHMLGHQLSVFVNAEGPAFPYLCLTVSGGHTQLALVRSHLDTELIGHTLDDAAGEAFDKVAKMVGLPYPGGPQVDRLARQGNPAFFELPKPRAGGFNFTFSGLKTSVLYWLQKQQAQHPDLLERHKADICATVQRRIVDYLLDQTFAAAKAHNLQRIAIVGGVSANSELRERFASRCENTGIQGFIPKFEYCTDNAGMIAQAGWQLWQVGQTAGLDLAPFASAEGKINSA